MAQTIKLIDLVENNIKVYNDKTIEGTRGLLLMPKNIDSSFLNNSSSCFLNNGFTLHESCFNISSQVQHYLSYKSSAPTKSLYSHMVDANGIAVDDKSILELPDLILIMYSSLIMAKVEVN